MIDFVTQALDKPMSRQRNALAEPSSRCRLARSSSKRPQLSTCENTRCAGSVTQPIPLSSPV